MFTAPSLLPRRLLLAACLLSLAVPPLHAQTAPGPAPVAPSIIANSNMETDADADGRPDGWPAGGTWENEEGNHFIRLTSTKPGSMVMLYREIGLPAGTAALELTWRQRTTNLKPGAKPWFDARIMMDFMDASRAKVSPGPSAPYARKNSAGWEEKSARFLVPAGATKLKFMPALFNVETGTLDLDDIVLRPIDAAPLKAAADESAAARAAKLATKTAANQARVAAALEAGGSIISNGNFETPGKSGDSAADWSKAGSWQTEADGNHFMRLKVSEPGRTALLFRTITLPAGVKAFELSLRWRISGLVPGDMPWFDARIMMDVKDAAGTKLKPQPAPIYSRKNTADGVWVERTSSFLVPEGGVALDLMPALFQAKAGTLDIDDLVLKPADSDALVAKQKEREEAAAKTRVPAEEANKAKWPAELRVQGNRLVTVDGGKEVWLQGLNVPSLDWGVNGEQVFKSVVVGIDEWKANVIRLPMKEEYWFGRKGQSDGGKSYRDLIDQVVMLAANRGAYVVIDLHRYRAPKPEYLEFWTDAATRYKNHPAVLFDLINEPHGTSWEVWRDGGFVGEKKDPDQAAFLTAEEKAKAQGFQSPGMQAMLDTVRATGAKNIVVVGGLDYAYDLTGITNGFALKEKSGGNGIMYASHVYPWKKGWQKNFLDAAALHPILLGEVGSDVNKMSWMPADQQEDAVTWTPAMLGLIQKYKLNWTGWSFHPKASPRMLLDWNYTPTPVWGQPAKDALSGKPFPPPDRLR
ncbi:MAG: glycoside hydrolase family 5 protein [Opitutaceae bacterium]|jgi:hypothetical protein